MKHDTERSYTGFETPPAVSVIIPCRNEKTHIVSCLESLLHQEPVPGGFEIIVADGMSDDGTRQILDNLAERHKRLRIVNNHRRFVAPGLNVGIAAARGSVIIRMDAHTRYAANYISECLLALKKTGADNVGGPARTEGESYVQSVICAAYHSPFAVGGARFHNLSYEGYVDTVPYGCWSREIFDRVGLFDEELVRNQDDEFNLRLTRLGGKIWQSPRIKSWYTPRPSLRALFRQYSQYGYWKVRVIQKHKAPASIRHLIPATFVLLLSALPVISLWSHSILWSWFALLAIYSGCNVTASLLTAAQNGWKFLPLLPVVFVSYHVAYGYGFLRGILDFAVLRRSPRASYGRLTRMSESQSD